MATLRPLARCSKVLADSHTPSQCVCRPGFIKPCLTYGLASPSSLGPDERRLRNNVDGGLSDTDCLLQLAHSTKCRRRNSRGSCMPLAIGCRREQADMAVSFHDGVGQGEAW